MLGEDLLADDRGVGCAAADGEVITTDDHFPAADAARSGNEVGSREAGQPSVGVVASGSGQCPDFAERGLIDQRGHTLADCQAAGVVLPPDLVRAAHLLGQLLPPAQLIQFRLPCHAGTS